MNIKHSSFFAVQVDLKIYFSLERCSFFMYEVGERHMKW